MEKEELQKKRDLLYEKFLFGSKSRKQDISYDLNELDILLDLYNGKEITDEELPYMSSIKKYEYSIIFSIINYINSNYGFYLDQAHNVLTRFDENKFDFNFHRRDYCDKRLSYKELMDIAYDFLSSYDERAYKLFREMKENEQFYTHEDLDYLLGLDGKCFSVNAFRQNFVMTRYIPKNLVDLSILIHEFGHCYEFSKLFDKNLEQRQGIYATNFNELSSFFFENSFYEYLFQNRINPKEALIAKDLFLNLLFEQFLQNYYAFNILGGYVYDPVVELDEKSSEMVDELIDKNFPSCIKISDIGVDIISTTTYGSSMLLALSLYNLYKENPKYFKKEFENALMSYGLSKDNEIYKLFGIDKKEMYECESLDVELKLHNYRKSTIL